MVEPDIPITLQKTWFERLHMWNDAHIASLISLDARSWSSQWQREMCIAEFKRRALEGRYDKLTDAQALLLMEVTS